MRSLHWIALVVVVVAGAGLAWFLLRDTGAPPPLLALAPAERPSAPTGRELEAPRDTAPRGGVYAGVVVDEAGQPIPEAHVLLVRYNAGDDAIASGNQSRSTFDPTLIPTIGDFHVSGERQTTDRQGRFRIASGARDRVQYVVAWKLLYSPGVVRTGKPEQEIRVVLKQGGLLKGTVVDPSGRPVAGARIDIYLQQKATPVKEGETVRVEPKAPAEMGLLGSFLGKVIGPIVWGFLPNETESLRTTSASDGTFHFGPVDDSVQIEVVITHPDYMWTEFDRGADQLVRRTVLAPGKTVERTYVLREGNWIEGRVVSDTDPDRGIEGVTIRLEHVVGYAMHWRYKSYARTAVTREDGSFRLAGLAQGPYVATITHSSFGSQFMPQIPENTKGLKWEVKSAGALQGEITGLETRPPGGRVEVLMEAMGSYDRGLNRPPNRQFSVLSKENTFVLPKIDPGDYRVSVRAGAFASGAETVTVRAHEVSRVSFVAAGGGVLTVRVEDRQGRRVDPVTLNLLRQDADGKETQLGTFTTRSGVMEEQALLPGTYRLEAWALGFLPAKSAAFSLALRQSLTLPPIVLRRPGWVKFLALVDERNQPLKEAQLEIREGEGEFRPLLLKGGDVPVAPGPLTVRVRSGDGLVFEETYEVEEGKVVEVKAVLRAVPPK
jgi:hypothetical protein